MNRFLKNIMPLLAVCLAIFIFSCNDNAKQQTAIVKAADSIVAPPQAPAPPVFKPFDVAEISHAVKNYDKWRPAFNNDSAARKASGLEYLVIGRVLDNPNSLTIFLSASDISKAKAFAANPRLKDVMQKNGVISKPEISYYHTIRFNPESKEKQWVMITHKVKDFDAWLKGYDAEGTETRATFGLVDVVLARGVDDPNIVQIVFDITDMAKAKARIKDPALKKIMMDAGVVGAPKITFYTSGE
jgi:hypothetical protein